MKKHIDLPKLFAQVGDVVEYKTPTQWVSWIWH